MLKLIVIFACIAVALGGHLGSRVIGGNPAQPGQFPYQISMRLAQQNSHHCGGTIINSRFIITAAHCVYQHYVNDFYIVTGSHLLSSGGQAYGLEAIAYHGDYNPQNMANDIAILKTNTDIQFNSYVTAIPVANYEVPVGSNLVLSGWGLTSFPGNAPPNNLQYTYLTSIDINECANALAPGSIFMSQICTFTRYGNGACQGDSGGPLVYNGALAGVVSWGRPCAIGYPDIFTKASAYIGWINDNMNILYKKKWSCQGDSGGPLVYNGALAGVVSWGRPCAIGYPDIFTKASAYIGWINDNMNIL